MKKKIPVELIKKAEKTSILDFAVANNIELIKNTNQEYMLADNHSLKINARDNLYNDFGQAEGVANKGGNVINFARYTCGYSFSEAIENILETPKAGEFKFKKNNYFSEKKEDYKYPRGIIKSNGEYKNVKNYLTNDRAIDSNTVDKLYRKNLIEETKQGEVFFHWLDPFDKYKSMVGGTIQGTEPLKNPTDSGRRFKKMIVKNSTSGYGFNFSIGEKPETIAFTESPIDTISYFENKLQKGEAESIHFQSLEGLKGNILENTIQKYIDTFDTPPKKIILAFDNDKAGKEAYLKYKDLDILKKNKIEVVSGIPKKENIDEKMDWNLKMKQRKSNIEIPNKLLKKGKSI